MLFDVQVNNWNNIIKSKHSNNKVFSGIITFSSELDHIVLDSGNLVSDLFILFYSINDFLELDTSSISLNDDTLDIQYKKYGYNTIILNSNVLDKKLILNTSKFCISILNKSSDFFTSLLELRPNSEYSMYLDIIKSLKNRILLRYSDE